MCTYFLHFVCYFIRLLLFHNIPNTHIVHPFNSLSNHLSIFLITQPLFKPPSAPTKYFYSITSPTTKHQKNFLSTCSAFYTISTLSSPLLFCLSSHSFLQFFHFLYFVHSCRSSSNSQWFLQLHPFVPFVSPPPPHSSFSSYSPFPFFISLNPFPSVITPHNQTSIHHIHSQL